MKEQKPKDLRYFIRKYGVKSCYKTLTQIHQFDPENAYLVLWYSRYDRQPKRFTWCIDTHNSEFAPISKEDAAKFFEIYKSKLWG